MSARTRSRCPTCRAEVDRARCAMWPFCSERCRMVDLGRWLGEEYRVPQEPDASGGGVERSGLDDDES